MQSRHIVRDGIESVEKYVETLSLKAQAQFPVTQPVITTAKKVSSPVIKGVRKIGDPVVDAIDNGLHSVVKNGTAFAGIAKNGMEASVGGALHVVDRVLTPPPNEPEPPKTIRGLLVHINNAIRYLCATKVKPVLGFDPYNKMLILLTISVYCIIFAYQICMTPWYLVRDRIAPTVLWILDHKCDASSHGAPNGHRDMSYEAVAVDEHSGGGDRDDEASPSGLGDERRNSNNGSASSGNGSNTTGARCSTGTGAGVNREAAKTGTSGHHAHTKRSRVNSAKTNAGSNSHDAET